jgi:UDP-GlcNAc:undecaprenyl-phosphate GlcNAc-1-phosphate transferase
MHELVLFLEALVITFLLTGAILRFSLKRKLYDIPNDRSSHSIPKPRLGGIAITLAFYVSCVTLLLLGGNPFPTTSMAVGVLAGGGIIALMGLADDLRGLNAKIKLLVQLGAAAIVIVSGVVLTELKLPLLGTLELGKLAVPFTLLWIVSIVNFYNFIDGIDGLAAGTGMIAAVFLVLIGITTGVTSLIGIYAIIAGSLLGFLRFNFPPARIFMGDMGSTFIGFMFAVCAVAGARTGIPAFVTILLLGGVLGDAVLTLGRRIAGRERIFSPHRTHYYQRLTSLGLSHKQVTLLEYLFAILLGGSALLAFHGDRIFITSIALIWLAVFLWAVVKIRSMEQGGRLFWEGRTLAVAFGDLVFIAASYALSYYLRLNFTFPEAETGALLNSLPLVLVIRTAVFFYYGHYRGVWRYTTFDDLVRMVKAVTLGTLIMVVTFSFIFRFEAFPRAVFIIDWFILTVFLAGSRIATRWFHELPSNEEVTGRRVAIGATGPVAEVILHEIKQVGGMQVIGYLDDRAEMTGRLIHGIEVLGTLSDAPRLVRRMSIEEIIVPASFAGRIQEEMQRELEDSGATIRFIADPSGITPVDEGAGHALLSGECILVAGNGTLTEGAGLVFAHASEMVILPGDVRTFAEMNRRYDKAPAGRRVYLGVLSDRRALREIIDRHNPGIIISDIRPAGGSVENAVAAYIRTVLQPVEILAREVVRGGGARLIVVHHLCGAESIGSADRAFEPVLRNIFRGRESMLTIFRAATEQVPRRWMELLAALVNAGGGVYEAGHGDGHTIEPIEIPPPPEDTGQHYLQLMRSLDEGDIEAMNEVLREMEETAAIGRRE